MSSDLRITVSEETGNVPVTIVHLIGDLDQGFKLGMMTLDRLRPTVATAACGMAARALEEALSHATRREQFGRKLAGFQLIQEKAFDNKNPAMFFANSKVKPNNLRFWVAS